jgi:acyl-CoA-binding protein
VVREKSDQEMSKPGREKLKKQRKFEEWPEMLVKTGQTKSRGA